MNTIKHHTRNIILAIASALALQFAAKAQTNTFPINGNGVSITNLENNVLNLYSNDKINIATNSDDILMQAGDGNLILSSNQGRVDITAYNSSVNISAPTGVLKLTSNETYVNIEQGIGIAIVSTEGDISLRTGSGDNITLISPHVKSTTPATDPDDLVRKDQLDITNNNITALGVRIDNIQLTPGPQGPKGDQGDSGSSVWIQSGTNLSYSSGNIGINTTSPTHPLTVNGAIRAREVIVDDTGWADYVFGDDYKLQSLDELEQHIKAEKHLPGIPCAAEVGKQGVSLGDMQTLLLSKIEELTLHQIDLNKRLNAQAEKLDQQSRELDALRQQNATLNCRLRQQ